MDVCRACLQTENEMISLDDFFVTSYNLFTNLNVTKNDGLPQHSCLNCVNILKAFTEFRAKAIASETTLREIVEHTKLEALEIETKVNIKEEGYCIKQEVETEIPLVPFSTDIYFSDYIDNESDNKHNLIDSNLKKLKNIKKKKSMSKKKTSKIKAQYQGTILENSLTTITKNIKRMKSKGADVGAEIFLCGLCKIKSEEESLTTHLEGHKIHKQCLICFETFNSWQQLFGHRIQHLPVHDRRCHLCEKRYATSTGLEYHYLSVHGEEQEITVKCKICLKSYDTARKLRKHITSVHPTTKHIFICDYCSKRCNTKSCLKVHMATHFDIRKYTCELCEFSCKVRSGLNGHILRKHTPEKVTCQKCKRIFRNQQFHDKHKCRIENFICPVCGKEIDSSKGSRFARHLKSHDPVGQFKCERCPNTYRTKMALKAHVNRHDGVRAFKCDYCPSRFFSASSLTKHHRTHTGEKPYVCNICSRAFMSNSNLKMHMKVHGLFIINHKNKDPEAGTIVKT